MGVGIQAGRPIGSALGPTVPSRWEEPPHLSRGVRKARRHEGTVYMGGGGFDQPSRVRVIGATFPTVRGEGCKYRTEEHWKEPCSVELELEMLEILV